MLLDNAHTAKTTRAIGFFTFNRDENVFKKTDKTQRKQGGKNIYTFRCCALSVLQGFDPVQPILQSEGGHSCQDEPCGQGTSVMGVIEKTELPEPGPLYPVQASLAT